MNLDFKGTIKSNYCYDANRKEIIIEIYDNDISDANGDYQKVGQINGWCYDTWHFNSEIIEMLILLEVMF